MSSIRRAARIDARQPDARAVETDAEHAQLAEDDDEVGKVVDLPAVKGDELEDVR